MKIDRISKGKGKCYDALTSAIIQQAIVDYERGKKKIARAKDHQSANYICGQQLIDEAIRFFHSEWFKQMANADGDAILKKIEYNYQTYGKCIPFRKDFLDETEWL